MAELVVEQPSFFTEVAALLTEDRLDGLEGLAEVAGDRLVRAVPVRVRSSTRTSPSTAPPCRAPPSCASAGSAASRWSRGPWARPSARSTSSGTSPRSPSSGWTSLVANLIEAYHSSITELDWMTDETKAEALDKLAKFRPHIGYPTKWRDYSALEITVDDLLGNVQRASSFELDRSLTKIGQPVDREEWLMTPQTVNAYYHPLKNEIVFPAAILQPPFFNEHADDAVNYGGIGAVIGHEIGHGFDDQGSTCDGDGALRDWWTEADRAAFEERTGALIGQYDALSPVEAPDVARERQADHRREHRRPRRSLDRPARRTGSLAGDAAVEPVGRLHRRAAAVPLLGGDLAVQVATRADQAAAGHRPALPPTSSAATRSSATSTTSTPPSTSRPSDDAVAGRRRSASPSGDVASNSTRLSADAACRGSSSPVGVSLTQPGGWRLAAGGWRLAARGWRLPACGTPPRTANSGTAAIRRHSARNFHPRTAIPARQLPRHLQFPSTDGDSGTAGPSAP